MAIAPPARPPKAPTALPPGSDLGEPDAIITAHSDDEVKAYERLADALRIHKRLDVKFLIAGKEVDIPSSLFSVLRVVILQLAKRQAISLVRHGEWLSPRKVAAILGVSRPYVTQKLLKADPPILHSEHVGTHWRIPLAEALRYRGELTQRFKKVQERRMARLESAGPYSEGTPSLASDEYEQMTSDDLGTRD